MFGSTTIVVVLSRVGYSDMGFTTTGHCHHHDVCIWHSFIIPQIQYKSAITVLPTDGRETRDAKRQQPTAHFGHRVHGE